MSVFYGGGDEAEPISDKEAKKFFWVMLVAGVVLFGLYSYLMSLIRG